MVVQPEGCHREHDHGEQQPGSGAARRTRNVTPRRELYINRRSTFRGFALVPQNSFQSCVPISRDWRGFPGKCRSRGVESNSDPRSLPLRGRPEPPAAATSPRRGGDPRWVQPRHRAREALDMVRAGLGYLAAADAAQLPAATQAECLARARAGRRGRDGGAGRVPGRVHRRGGARRGRGLQRGVLADPPDRDHPRRRRRAQRLGQAGRHASAGAGGAGGRAGLGVRRAGDLPVDRQAPAGAPGCGR